jgi:hypothetical protein
VSDPELLVAGPEPSEKPNTHMHTECPEVRPAGSRPKSETTTESGRRRIYPIELTSANL